MSNLEQVFALADSSPHTNTMHGGLDEETGTVAFCSYRGVTRDVELPVKLDEVIAEAKRRGDYAVVEHEYEPTYKSIALVEAGGTFSYRNGSAINLTPDIPVTFDDMLAHLRQRAAKCES